MTVSHQPPEGKVALSHQALSDWTMAVIRAASLKHLRPSCVSVAAALAVKFMNRRTGACYPKLETIAVETGLPLSTVKAAIKILKEAGFLSWGRAWFNGPSSYRFVIPGSLARETPTSFSGSLASETYEGLASETYEPRIGTEKDYSVPSVPPLSPLAGHPAGGFDPSFQEESHAGATVVAPPDEQVDFAIAIEWRKA